MAYLSLYRKYRSQTFEDLVGQDHVVRTLQNAIQTGRISHAYLFTGPRGTGKTSSARLLAKALNAENGPTATPSDDDPICQMIAAGTCPDVQEFDAASEAGVENVREAIVEDSQYRPMMCRYKIYIIDEVHDLSAKAFDALLKTIEEPPDHIVFILSTTEYNKVPPTIRSRCQKFEFHRASLSDLVARIEYVAKSEGIDIESQAVNAIARMADGGYRDALTLLEQASLTSDGKVTLTHVFDQLGLVAEETIDSLLKSIKQADVPQIMELLGEIARRGRDPRAILESMLYRLSDLTRASYGVEIGGSGDAAQEAAMHAASADLGREFLLGLRGELAEAHKEIRDISLPRLWLESELIRIALAAQSPRPRTEAVAKPESQVKVSAKAASAEPKPAEPAKPKEAPAAEKPAVAAVVETGDPEFDAAAKAWSQAFQELSVLSKTMAARLADAKIGRVDGQVVFVEFARQLDLDWVKDTPKRTSALVEAVRNRLGDDWQIELGVAKRDNGRKEPQAVELPLEGQQLADTVREIFNAG